MVSLDSPWTSWYLFLFKIIEKVPSFNKEIMISGDFQTYTSLHTLIFRVLYSIPIYDILFFVKQINYGFWVHILFYWTFWPKNGFWEFGNKMPEMLQLGYQSVSISKLYIWYVWYPFFYETKIYCGFWVQLILWTFWPRNLALIFILSNEMIEMVHL